MICFFKNKWNCIITFQPSDSARVNHIIVLAFWVWVRFQTRFQTRGENTLLAPFDFSTSSMENRWSEWCVWFCLCKLTNTHEELKLKKEKSSPPSAKPFGNWHGEAMFIVPSGIEYESRLLLLLNQSSQRIYPKLELSATSSYLNESYNGFLRMLSQDGVTTSTEVFCLPELLTEVGSRQFAICFSVDIFPQ